MWFAEFLPVDAENAVAFLELSVGGSFGKDVGDFKFLRLFQIDFGPGSGDAEIDEPAAGFGVRLSFGLLVPGGIFAKSRCGDDHQ